jgi:hypothetical protein
MATELHATYDGMISAAPSLDMEPLGDCARCNGDLYEVAYEWGGTVLCPSCAKDAAIAALHATPEDELDGFPQPERAMPCWGCGRYSCVCRDY